MKKAIKTACCMVLMGVMCLMSVSPGMTTGARVTTGSPSYRVTEEERDRFFGKSAIIGNSIGLGLKYYFATKEDGYLGNPQMLVWGCYSFINDFTNIEKYMIHYQGSPMKARDAVKACGAQHVFINMGTNDFNTSQSQTFSHYKRLIREIKNTNPDVDIFILGTTPTRIGKGLLNNSEINKLNDQMSSLAERRSNMYYIDINTPMKDSEGRLRADYASDGFVHLSTTAYQTWTSTMVRYVRQLLRREKKAKYQVRQAEKKLSQETYDKAAEAVAELENSSLKKELKQRLRTVRKRWEELQAATPTPMIATGGSVTGFAVAGVEEPVTVTGPAVSPIPTLIPTPTPTTDPNELTDLEQRKADYFSTHRITRLRTEKQVEKRVRLKWKKQFGADDYSVYRSEDKDDGYEKIGTTKKSRFTDKKAEKKKTYYYYIQASMTIRNHTFLNKKSKVIRVCVQLKKPVTVIAGECFVVDMVHMNSVFNKNHHFVAKIGVNTYTMQHSNYFPYNGQMITGIERIAYYNPDRVYFLIGANEAAWTQPSFSIKNYKRMRRLLKKINKDVEIVLIKIPPFGWSSTQNIPSVSRRASFNKAYREFAAEHDDVYFCPATNVLADSTSHLLKKYDGGDGCHWNESGTAAVVAALKSWSKKKFGNW